MASFWVGNTLYDRTIGIRAWLVQYFLPRNKVCEDLMDCGCLWGLFTLGTIGVR
jgi:hypothetical protein